MNRVWGHCAVCQQLVRIIPGEWKPGLRQQRWWPVAHEADGKPCPGAERSI